MNRLEEVHALLYETHAELQEEGLNVVSYWFARANIDQEEFLKVVDTIIQVLLNDEDIQKLSGLEKLRVIITHGFIFGLVYGREKQENEL